MPYLSVILLIPRQRQNAWKKTALAIVDVALVTGIIPRGQNYNEAPYPDVPPEHP